MKIALAQIQPRRGDIAANVEIHRKWIDQAASVKAEWVLFPELSLTGYEPTLAKTLALPLDDQRLDIFQELADRHHLNIALGVPIQQNTGVCIGTVLFNPEQPQRVYTKHYLHPDEEPYFVAGQNESVLIGPGLALAICYELSIPEHAERATASGAGIYLTSVAKTAVGIQQSKERLADIARTYAMCSLLVNSVGPSDDFVGAGHSFVLDKNGELLGQLGEAEEGLLIYDTNTLEVIRPE